MTPDKRTGERLVLDTTNSILALMPHIDGFAHSTINHKVDEIIRTTLTQYHQDLMSEVGDEIDLVGKYAEKAMFLKSRETDEANYPLIKKLTDEEYITFRDVVRTTLTPNNQDCMREKQALLQSIWDAFKDQSEIGVNHLRVELEAHGIKLE